MENNPRNRFERTNITKTSLIDLFYFVNLTSMVVPYAWFVILNLRKPIRAAGMLQAELMV
jgi:hypothetical protein